MPTSPHQGGRLGADVFGLKDQHLCVVRIQPTTTEDGQIRDVIGVVTTFEGQPTAQGEMASRIGGFEDVAKLEASGAEESKLILAHSTNVKGIGTCEGGVEMPRIRVRLATGIPGCT